MTLAAPVPLWPSEIYGSSSPFKVNVQTVARSSPKQPSDNLVSQGINSTHTSAPNHRPQHAMEKRDMSSPSTGRTSEHRSVEIQERDLARDVAAALVVDFGHYRSTHKTIAQHAGASPETVKRWIAADSAPSLVYFLRLLPHSPALQGVVRKLCQMESDLHPDFQREFVAFMQLVGKGMR